MSGSRQNQVSGDENIFKKNTSREQKNIQNQTTCQKSHQRDLHMSCPPRKIVGDILKVD